MHNLIAKENKIFDIIQEFLNEKLEFIMVGGYAVSSYKHRFSVDADIVIKKEDFKLFEDILKKEDFRKTISKELENIYGSEFVRYEKDDSSIDFLIDAVACRQTNASFGYGFLKEHSSKRKIIGIEREIVALVPRKEVLIITKIHSARLTDLRDVAALANGSDLAFIQNFLWRGDKRIVQENLKQLHKLVNDKRFIDSFKGVFMEKKFDIDLNKLKKISEIIEKNE